MQQVSGAGDFDRLGKAPTVAGVLGHPTESEQAGGACQGTFFRTSDVFGPSQLFESEAHGNGLAAAETIGGAAEAGVRGGLLGHGDGLGLSNGELHSGSILVPISAPVNILTDEIRVVIGSRLREERERLKLSQTEMAERGGSSKRSLLEWEKGQFVPTAEFLARMAAHDMDVLYVVTGQRLAARDAQTTGVRVEPEEMDLLENYRACGGQDQAMVRRVARLASTAAE